MEKAIVQKEQKAWKLYCEETAGGMHVMDFWWELPQYVKDIYLKKVDEVLTVGD